MTTFWIVVAVMCGVLLVPYLAFICVKIGTYAFYSGRRQFLEEQEKRHGEKKQ